MDVNAFGRGIGELHDRKEGITKTVDLKGHKMAGITDACVIHRGKHFDTDSF